MASPTYTKFQHIQHIGNTHITNELENNLKMFYDWALLSIGGWTDVDVPTSGAFGGDFSKLRLVQDPSYTLGQVWEAARKDWVWETGVNYADTSGTIHNPNSAGTPIVNGSATSDSYTVNYPLGRIIFDTAISTSATVKMAHAYRDVQVYRADSAQWYQEIQQRSERVDNSHFTQLGSGNWSIGAQHRIQLPVIIIEAVPQGGFSMDGYELGSNALWRRQDVNFHVIAEDRATRNTLVDIISLQSIDKPIWLFNSNSILSNNDYPLDYNGNLVSASGFKCYPTFVDTEDNGGYRWRKCWLKDSRMSELESIHPYLFEGLVRTTFEVILGPV